MTRITISDEDYLRACKFSEQVLPTNINYFFERNQSSAKVAKSQIVIGKLGELAVYNWLTGLGKNCTDVDFNVTSKKSYMADLVVDDTNCHIKSQHINSAKRFGLSWTFQFSGNGRGHRDHEIFDNYNKDDFVFFCLVESNKLVDIKSVVRLGYLHKYGLFKDPIKKNLVKIKKVVYFEDIPPKYRR